MLFYLTAVLLLASAQAKFYIDCGSKLATRVSVGVSGCAEYADECVLHRNSNATISIDFTPSTEVKSVEAVVHGKWQFGELPFPLPQPDACKNSGISCPAPSGTKVSYRATVPVLKSYPKVKVEVKWELKTEDGEDLVCILILVRIK